MSIADDKAKTLPATPAADYEIGHGKPPASARFSKGRSGNPGGRPKGARNKIPAFNEERLKQIVMEEAYRTIKVNDGERQIKLPMAQAVIRAMAMAAVKGKSRAQTSFAKLLTAVESDRKAQHDEWLDQAMDYKLKWDRELERRKRLGLNLPDPVPHPNQFIVDPMRNTVCFSGPMLREHQAMLEKFQKRAIEENRNVVELMEEAHDQLRREIGSSD
jgi:hypothetical protein